MTLCTRHIGRSTALQWVTYIVAAVVTMNQCSAFGVPLTMSRTTTISSSRTISTTTLRAERQSIANNDDDDDDDDSRINSALTTKQATLFASTTTDDPRSEEEEEGVRLRESLLTVRLDLPFLRNRSVVKTSTIDTAGRGLFATRTIQEGEIITCTPGDGLLTTTTTTARNTTTPIRWGSHVGQQERGIAFDSVVKYALSIDDTYAILGHPALDEDSSYYGHYANDGAGHILFQKNVLASNNNDSDDDDDDGDDNNTVIEAMESDYLFESLTVNNARHRPLGGDGEQYHTVMVATRDIQAGEEIFVMYGPDYWWGHP